MVFQMLFALIMIGALIYTMSRFLPKVFLNFRKTLNPMMIDFLLVKDKGVSHLGTFGASRAFEQMDLDLSDAKEPKLQVKLKPELNKVYVEFICFDQQGKYTSVLLYQVVSAEETLIHLPKNTTHVIPVVTMIDGAILEWNTYLLPKRQFLSFAVTESIAIGLVIHYLIQFVYFFYQTFTSTCPLCQFGNQPLLEILTWLVGSLSFIAINLFGRPRFSQYMYGG
jgi:hypothetical protein